MRRRARINSNPLIAAIALGAMAVANMGPGCGADHDITDLQTIETGIPFDATPGAGFRVIDAESTEELGIVIFEEVTEDSRCPTGVDCVWEGEATVQISLTNSDGSTRTESLTLPGMREDALDLDEAPAAVHDTVRVHLLRLRPYPRADQVIGELQYTATFVALPAD